MSNARADEKVGTPRSQNHCIHSNAPGTSSAGQLPGGLAQVRNRHSRLLQKPQLHRPDGTRSSSGDEVRALGVGFMATSATLEEHFEGLLFGGVAEDVVGLHELTQAELVRDELSGLQLSGEDRFE